MFLHVSTYPLCFCFTKTFFLRPNKVTIFVPKSSNFQSKEIDPSYSLPPIVHAFHGSKVAMGRKLATQKCEGLQPLPISLLGVEQAPPLWTHPDGCDFIRGTSIKSRQSVMHEGKITDIQALLLKCLWTPVELPNHNNCYTPWPRNCQPANTKCGQNASLPPNAGRMQASRFPTARFNLPCRHCKNTWDSTLARRSWNSTKSSPAKMIPATRNGNRCSFATYNGKPTQARPTHWRCNAQD